MACAVNKQRRWQNRPILGVLLMLLGLALYPLSDSFIKYFIHAYSLKQTSFLRAATRLIPLLIAVFFQGGFQAIFSTHKVPTHILRLGINLVQTFAFLFAFSLGSLTVVYTFGYSSSFCMIILSSLLLKEVVRKEKWLAVAIGLVGILIALRPNTSLFGPLALIVLIGSFFGALNKVFMRHLAKTEHSLAIAIYPNLVMILASAPFLYKSWQPMPWSHWGLFALVGLLTAGAQYSMTQALRFAQGSVLASIDYSSFLWVLLLDFIGWGVI